MKIQYFICFTLLSISSIAQELKYSDLQGQKPKGSFSSYLSKDGETYGIGDTIQLGLPTGVDGGFIYIRTYGLATLVTSSYGSASASVSNQSTIIKEIVVLGNKTSGWYVQFKTKNNNGGYFITVENAIEVGELKAKGMTSDEALTELKKAKDKLDLGLITQVQYDSLKSVLVKYIK